MLPNLAPLKLSHHALFRGGIALSVCAVLLTSACDVFSGPDEDPTAIRITSISPSTIVKDYDEYFPIIIRGKNFTPSSVVHWAGGPQPTEFVSAEELRIDWGDYRWVIDYPVEVHTPADGGPVDVSNTVKFRVTPPSHSSTRFTVRGISIVQRAWAAAAMSESIGYVGALWSDTVYKIDMRNLRVDAVLRAGRVPYDFARLPDRSRLFSSGNEDATIGAIIASSGVATARTTLASAPRRIVVSPNGATLYATLTDGSVAFLNPTTFGSLATPTMVGGTVLGLAVSPDGTRLWTTSTEGDVIELNTATRAVGRSFEVAGELQDVVFGPGGASLYIANESGGYVGRYSVATLQRLDSIPVSRPWGLALSPDGKELWVSRNDEDAITILSTTTNTPIDSIDVGNGVRRISFASNNVVLMASENNIAYVVRRK